MITLLLITHINYFDASISNWLKSFAQRETTENTFNEEIRAPANTICNQYKGLIILWKIEDRVWTLIMRIFMQIPICKGVSSRHYGGPGCSLRAFLYWRSPLRLFLQPELRRRKEPSCAQNVSRWCTTPCAPSTRARRNASPIIETSLPHPCPLQSA